MPKRIIPNELRQKISRLYDSGRGLSPAEIARRTEVSYASVYGMTKARQRINPDTGKPFESYTAYREHLARQRINPDTGEPFESGTQYYEHLARQRSQKEVNRELSDFVKRRLKELCRTQSWLAEELGISRQMISFYTQGNSVPKGERLRKLRNILDSNRNKGKSLDHLIEEDNL